MGISESPQALDHLESFDNERKVNEISCALRDADIKLDQRALQILIGLFRPELIRGLYERRPCSRLLRYVGMDGNDDDVPFAKDNVYHSLDFNGGTYTIEMPEKNSVIGYAYFERI